MCFTFIFWFYIYFFLSVVHVILNKQCCCQCLLSSLVTIQSPPTSSQDCSLCPIIWWKTCRFIKDLSVSIQLTAEAGNVLWAVISTRVLVVTENKWDLWCQPEWHQQHEKQRVPRPAAMINLCLEPIPILTPTTWLLQQMSRSNMVLNCGFPIICSRAKGKVVHKFSV